MVLGAAGIRHQLRREAGAWVIAVRPQDEQQARAELEAYRVENRDWKTKPPPALPRANGWAGVVVFVAILITVDVLQRYDALGHDWFAAGRMQTASVREGQWWRTVTALSLHLDSVHLMANISFGILFGLFAGQLLGSGLAWISILVAGALGNALNAAVQPATHSAVGASTSIFAALGILSAYTWKTGLDREHRWSRRLVPLIGGVAMLAFIGFGGERTDFMAHLTGFFCGILLGAFFGWCAQSLRLNVWAQVLLGTLAVGLLAYAWMLGLQQTAGGR